MQLLIAYEVLPTWRIKEDLSRHILDTYICDNRCKLIERKDLNEHSGCASYTALKVIWLSPGNHLGG